MKNIEEKCQSDLIKGITPTLTYHDGVIEIKNVSISGGDEIQLWLIPNGEKYDLYIGLLEKIYANYDSSYLFYNASAENIYFNSSFVKKMNNTAYVFHQCNKLDNINIHASSIVINKVIQLLPDRTSLTTGNIITKTDKSTLEITTAETKNWQII